MSRTYKDKNKSALSKARVGKKTKREAGQKRKTLSLETNPRVLKLKSADNWDFY